MKIFQCIFCNYQRFSLSAPKGCPVCYASADDFEEIQGDFYNYIPLLKFSSSGNKANKVSSVIEGNKACQILF